MRGFWKLLCGVIVPAVLMTMVVGTPASADPGVAQQGTVGEVPWNRTPYVMNNKVFDMAEIGDRIVVAGSFTEIRNAPGNGGNTFAQRSVFAFDPATGRIDTNFLPQINGNVNAILPGPGGTVYLGGSFTTVNGNTTGNRNLVQLSMANGQRVTTFRAPAMNGLVNDLALAGGRLYVGGFFDTMGGAPHGGLATLNPTTGAVDEYLGVDLAVNHNWDGTDNTARTPVGTDKLDVTPDGSRLVVIGNFKLADGLSRDQLVLVNLAPGGAVVDPNWRTTRYQPACYSWAFDHYVRDLAISPDGSYFSVVASGGGNAGTLCDALTRWEFSDSGQDVQPRWAEYTGGDSLFSVEITGDAIYTGGHQRWMNNTYGRDFPGAGAVPRAGISAHDPRTGNLLAWNPGRNPRGVGVEAMLSTAAGLYIGMDTKYVGNFEYWRPGLAFFPLGEGLARAPEDSGTLPGNVYLGGQLNPSGGGTTGGEVLYRINAGGPQLAALDGGPAWAGDTGTTNPLRTSGSNTASYSEVPAVDGSVPSSTPSEVFSTERWDPNTAPAMTWNFPVASGTTVDVRIYLANRCTCTQNPGQRKFDVSVEGSVVLDDYDMAADVGHDVGTVKTFTVTSDGTVTISFGHVVENPTVNAIEIVESTGGGPVGPVGRDDVAARWFDGDTAGPDVPATGGGLEWSRVRGAFMAGGTLFYGYPGADNRYSLFARTFDGTSFGEPTELLPYFDPEWSDVQTGSGQTYRGALPTFWSQISSVSSMFLADGRLYYTRTGTAGLWWRGFSVDSGVVGAEPHTVATTGFGDVAGAFVSGNRFFWAVRSTGELRSTAWNGGAPNLAAGVLEAGPSVDGRSWSSRGLFVGPGDPPVAPNQPPTAAFSFDCTGLACSFDAGDSTDADGSITGYAWDFDGTPGTGETATHAFSSAGDKQVTLTVTDDDGATAQSTQTVAVNQPDPGAAIALRGAVGTSARTVTSVSVDVPAAVQPGDGLIAVLSTNSAVTGVTPTGWTLVRTQVSGSGPTTQVFQKVAGTGDAGSPLAVTLSGQAKVTLNVLAYSGTAAGGPVAAVTGASDAAGTSHTTPSATVGTAGSWVVSVWSDKGASARTWTAPGAVTERSSLAGVGSGDIATLVADNGPVAAGTVPGRTATVSSSSTRATMLTIVLAPGAGSPPPPNATPEAQFDYLCSGLTCDFDATPTTDDGSIVAWAWDFAGEGTSSTGPTVSHTFTSAGDKEVRLVVTDDDGATDDVVVTVPVAAPPPVTGIGLRGSAGTAARQATAVTLDVPAGVQAGDGLVLVLSTNSTVTGTAPTGWTQEGVVVSGNAPTTQVFERVATAADAGSQVVVALSGQAKVTLQLLAYSGTAASGPIASVTTAADGAGTAHTTPTATAPAGSWVLSVWSDKQAAAREWVPPTTGVTARSNIAGIGTGDIATLVADSGGPVAGGTVGGHTATVPTASNRATMLTVVLAAG